MMLKPICVPCGLFFQPEKNGFAFTEGMPRGGTWRPYKVWVGDKWKCRGCGTEIVVGVMGDRVAEHYEADFEEIRKRLNADQFQVNDC